VLEWLAGHWQLALDRATTAHELGEQLHGAHSGFTGRWKALVEADLGLVEQARASAEQSLAHAQASSNESFVIVILGVLGRLELSLGNLEAAGDCLRELPRRLKASGMKDPTQPIWPDTIETLVALGELDQARAYLEDYERYAVRLRSPLAMEVALRCRGLVCAADGDTAGALAAFERALTDRSDPPWVFERGRTLLCLGTVRRQAQQKKAAREVLEQALSIFEELGARLWAEKARAELRRISGRRTAAELTETERQVAELAAQGSSNKEIAAQLFMGVSTVEAHLSRVYRKLGVRSRNGLGPELAKHRDGTRPDLGAVEA
jgi:ATP/maltotriose-dependent transcriptional regulator MalT